MIPLSLVLFILPRTCRMLEKRSQKMEAAFMARSQIFNYADNFSATITTAAWRTKPSWMLVAGSDRTINPELERWYAARAKSRKVEVPDASHVVYISHPKEVAALIEEATRNTSTTKTNK
jgi:pimeloyl-ACP methyl ester carboxylesterase